jgi:endo-1,4-beta-xylanase
VSGENSLRSRAAAKGLIYGANPGVYAVYQDSEVISAFLQESGMLACDTFFWMNTQPEEGNFNFSRADAFVQFAIDHQLRFRGHTLVWYRLNPDWLNAKLSDTSTPSSKVESLLTQHVSTLVGRYAGKVYIWDVVNEAIEPDQGRADGLAHHPWFNHLGPDYIEMAFRTAAAADPNALLAYNDGGQEYDLPINEAKREAVLKLLQNLKSKGVPIHVFGLQAHLYGDARNFNAQKLRQFLADVASLDIKIMISELDVMDYMLPADISQRDQQVAAVYEDFLNLVLDEPNVIVVNNWGISDRYTWLSEQSPRPDGQAVRPLPLDDQMNRKPAWAGIARAFDHCPPR